MIRRNHRLPLFFTFAFCMVATLSFLIVKNQDSTSAADLSKFKAGDIISDEVMTDYNSMSVSDIQNFLKSKNSCNNTNVWVPSNGKITSSLDMSGTYNWHVENGHFVCLADESFDGESAAQIIYNAAHDYKINPKVIIVLLQKEQGLITDTRPRSGQYRSATGYGCPDTAACDSQYYGFKNQVRNAASLFHTVLDGGWTNYPVGNNYIYYNPNRDCGGSDVYIANRATSALYRYTPYQPNASALAAGYGAGDSCGAYGNRNFYAYFTDWFGDTHSVSGQTVIVGQSALYLPEDKTFTISTSAGKYLGASGSANGTQLKLTTTARTFRFKRTEEGYYKIIDTATNKVLDVADASTSNGAKIQLYADNDTCAQKWSVSLSGDKYVFTSVCSGKVIDVPNGSIAQNNLAVQTYTANNSSAQTWTLTAQETEPITSGTYAISTTAGKYLNVSGSSIVLGDSQRSFKLTRTSDGFYSIIDTTTGKSLDITNGKTVNGTKIQLYDYNGSCAQRWTLTRSGSAVTIQTACAPAKSLDVANGATNISGTNIQLWDTNSTAAQTWQLTNIESQDNYLPDGTYTLRTTAGKYITAASNSSGSRLKTSASAQDFKLTRTSDGFYTITHASSGLNVDLSDAAHANGTIIQLYAKNSSCAQKWALVNQGSSNYSLRSACSGKAIDVPNASISSSNINLHTWEYNASAAQIWVISSKDSATVSSGSVYKLKTTAGTSLSSAISEQAGNSRTASGAKLQISTSNLSVNNYQYKFNRLDNGLYVITHTVSGKAIDVSGGSRVDGTKIQLWDRNDSCSQQWALVKNGSNYMLRSACSGKALDVTSGKINVSGTNAQLWTANSSAAQTWVLTAASNQAISNGTYNIASAIDSNRGFDIDGGANSAKNGTNIQLWDLSGSTGKDFEIAYIDNKDAYIIRSKATGRVIDLSNAKLTTGNNIQTWDYDSSTCAQFWRFQDSGNGTYNIVSSCGDYVLDATGGKATNGTNIQLWSYNNTAAQRWKLIAK